MLSRAIGENFDLPRTSGEYARAGKREIPKISKPAGRLEGRKSPIEMKVPIRDGHKSFESFAHGGNSGIARISRKRRVRDASRASSLLRRAGGRSRARERQEEDRATVALSRATLAKYPRKNSEIREMSLMRARISRRRLRTRGVPGETNRAN